MTLTRVLQLLVLSTAVASGAPVLAQGLDSSIVQASELTEEQKAKIREFVEKNRDGLSANHAEIKRSRSALMNQLQKDAKVSVAFRLEYSRLLVPTLRPLVGSDREQNAINALRVAGELATTSGLEILTDALSEKRQAVRFAAVDGFAATFGAIEATAPAIAPAQQAIRAVSTLKAGMEKETDPKVLEAYTLALRAATKVPSAKLAGVRAAAVTALCEGISAKARAAKDSAFDASFRRAVNSSREALTVQAINEPKLEAQQFQAAAGMAGDLLACLSRRLKAGELAAGDDEATKRRAEFVLIAADAERTIQWANTGLAGSTLSDLKLSELLAQSKDDEFQTAVLRLIGPMGALTDKPFGFEDSHFTK